MNIFQKSKVAIIAALVCSMVATPVFAGNHNGPRGNGHQQTQSNRGHMNNGNHDRQPDRHYDSRQNRDHDQNRPAYNEFGPHDARNLALTYKHYGYHAQPEKYRHEIRPGAHFPHGAERRPVPEDMRRHLPHRDGYEWHMSGTDLVLVGVATGVIASVMAGVFR